MSLRAKVLSWVCCHLAFMGYMLAVFGLLLITLPADAFWFFDRTGSDLKLREEPIQAARLLILTGISLSIGIVFHWIACRFDIETKVRRVYYLMGVFVVAMLAIILGLSFCFARFTTVHQSEIDQWLQFGGLVPIAALSVVLLLICTCFFSIRFHPGNRMARKLQVHDYLGAIRIGESIPEMKRGLAVRLNLIRAYLDTK